ncbi:MAG: hypothetical protein H0T42_33890 [Deltaproteobacteria bacterium]|nr:hypothetical protein [Deltaproteobacteria bacterium]
MLMLVVLWSGACAKDVHVRYPSAPDDPTGTVVLLLSTPAKGVSVAINGRLIVHDAHTGRIVISGAPVGTEEIVMTANGAEKAMRVWVGTEYATTVPLGVPEPGSGFLKSLFGTLVTIVAYSLLR